MEPKTSSPAKEAIRQKNEAEVHEKPKSAKVMKIVGVLLGILSIPAGIVMLFAGPVLFVKDNDPVNVIFMALIFGFGTFAVCGIGAVMLVNAAGKKEKEATSRAANQKTRRDIRAYEDEVEQYCQKALQKAADLAPMTDRVTDMLERMISHADAGPNRKFLEATLFYTVKRTGIVFSYASNYSNPADDYNFDLMRFRNLNSDAECEGLAQALARLTVQKIKKSYPPNSIADIKISHTDAAVTIYFKAVNKNFQPSKDIF